MVLCDIIVLDAGLRTRHQGSMTIDKKNLKTLRILIVGGGAIGGTLSANLLLAGYPVVTVCRDLNLRQILLNDGFHLSGVAARGQVFGSVVGAVPDYKQDIVFMATRPSDLRAALQEVTPCLKRDGVVVILQNGLCEQLAVEAVGVERVVGAIVAWGASADRRGHFVRTSLGGMSVGHLGGVDEGRLAAVIGLLSHVGPVKVTDNLLGARWSKLGFNCAISTLGTLMGCELGAALRTRAMRKFAIGIISEVVKVAEARGIFLTPVGGPLPLSCLAERSELGPSAFVGDLVRHVLLWCIGLRYGRLRSSMLRAIEAGKIPDVDFLNGIVIQHGLELGLVTPYNLAARDGVWAISRGEASAGLPWLVECLKKAEGR